MIFPFAYPGGRFKQCEHGAVERAGYDYALIVKRRCGSGQETDRFLLKHEQMLASDTLDWFGERIDGHYETHYLWAWMLKVKTR